MNSDAGRFSAGKTIAVLADIHSNHLALEACVARALQKGADAFFFLGDYLGDLAYPQKTLRLLYEMNGSYPCRFLRGNKEDYWLARRTQRQVPWQKGSSATGMLAYNFERLGEKDLDFMAQMPIAQAVCLGGWPELLLCHGSPFRVNESMRPDLPGIDALTARLTAPLVLCGHFHIQTDYVRNGVRVLNPGAVGVPLHSGGQAQFLLLHAAQGGWEPEFVTLPYDVERALAEMEEERLAQQAPSWSAVTRHLLLTGEVSHAEALERVIARCRRQGLPAEWPDLPESAWRAVAEELTAEQAEKIAYGYFGQVVV